MDDAINNSEEHMSMSQVLVVALTLWGEARGEPLIGKMAVASVIWNRAGGKPEGLRAECLKPKQFSCWNTDVRKRFVQDGLREQREQTPAWKECYSIAQSMFNGRFKSTFPATNYCVKTCNPYWLREMLLVREIGNHRFYVPMRTVQAWIKEHKFDYANLMQLKFAAEDRWALANKLPETVLDGIA